jgi:hypothetical protein
MFISMVNFDEDILTCFPTMPGLLCSVSDAHLVYADPDPAYNLTADKKSTENLNTKPMRIRIQTPPKQ